MEEINNLWKLKLWEFMIMIYWRIIGLSISNCSIFQNIESSCCAAQSGCKNTQNDQHCEQKLLHVNIQDFVNGEKL